ncbi:MAG: hypothetical protein JJ892_07195 [Balneola sp.]|nr:hypothetical protein [Balneola sp.]MBO6650916.1 hypothetical protein [Balneola sp.]MBO6711858.1 hypothetical protein [Balneola sp.]MBO6800053.1 hypothetical protein [Balneola sp.]MBO6871566.1 hypothetical protein [Balneola sp.]
MGANVLKDFQVVSVSDVNGRDGMGIEVWSKEKILIEIFRDDENENFNVTLFEESLPLKLIEESIEYFKHEIPKEFDK